MLGAVTWSCGLYQEAATSWASAARLAGQAGLDLSVATYAANLALIEHSLGDLAAAERSIETTLAAFRRHGDEFHVIRTLNKLGVLAMDQAQLDAAEALSGLADLRIRQERAAEAVTLYGLLLASPEVESATRRRYEAGLNAARRHLADAEAERALRRAAETSIDEAIAALFH